MTTQRGETGKTLASTSASPFSTSASRAEHKSASLPSALVTRCSSRQRNRPASSAPLMRGFLVRPIVAERPEIGIRRPAAACIARQRRIEHRVGSESRGKTALRRAANSWMFYVRHLRRRCTGTRNRSRCVAERFSGVGS